MLRRLNLRTSFLGTVGLATDSYAVIGKDLGHKKEFMEEVLSVPVIEVNIFETNIVGILANGNSKGLLVSPKITLRELEFLKNELPDGIEVDILETKTNAIGNIMVVNDEKALVGAKVSEKNVSKIEEVLGVEVMVYENENTGVLGSSLIVTNEGGLISPDLDNEFFSNFFDIFIDSGTSNKGVKEVGTCIIANSSGALTGESTTGPELGIIERSLRLF